MTRERRIAMELVGVVADVFGVEPYQVISKTRTEVLADARCVVASFLRHNTHWTVEVIGKCLNRHHSTVVHMSSRYHDLMETDSVFAERVAEAMPEMAKVYERLTRSNQPDLDDIELNINWVGI